MRLYLTPSLSLTGDTNISLIGLVYWTWEFLGLSTQVSDFMGTPNFDESCNLFDDDDDRNLPKRGAALLLPLFLLPEECFLGLLSLAVTICGETWL